jgi:RNA polymerase sigma-70 factor (ECF subfamily)
MPAVGMNMGKHSRRIVDTATLADEVALLRRVADGDRDAFDVLYRAYFRRLHRFLEQVTHRPELVGEIVNDCMLVVWRKAGTFNHGSRVSTWIFAIAYRRALKALKRAPDPSVEVALDEDSAQSDPGLEQALIDHDMTQRLRTALGGLSADQRAVVELTYYHGYAYRETAQIVGCPVDTVKTRMFHARRKLRLLLAQPDGA